MAKPVVCCRCRRQLADREVKSPRVLVTEYGLICEQCAPEYQQALSEMKTAALPEASEIAEAPPAEQAPQAEPVESPAPVAPSATDEVQLPPPPEPPETAAETAPAPQAVSAGSDVPPVPPSESPAPPEPGAAEAAASGPPSPAPPPTPARAGPVEPQPDAGEPVSPEPETEGETPRDALDLLDEIRREVTLLRRSLTYEKHSLWNVLGAATQCFAFGALVMACVSWARNPTPALLLALLLQLMALTFFFQAK